MSFSYEKLVNSYIVSNVKATMLINSLNATQMFVRMLHLHNASDAAIANVELFFVPAVAGAQGVYNSNDRILFKTFAVGESLLIEYPVPGLIFAHNDRLEIISSVSAIINCNITGGRES